MASGRVVFALGRMGELGIWRAAVYFLPACVTACRRRVGVRTALAIRRGGVHLACARGRRNVDVGTRARVAIAQRGGGRCGLFRGKSVQSGAGLLPERLRRTAYGRDLSTFDFGGTENCAGRLGAGSVLRDDLCRAMDVRRPRRCDCDVFRSATARCQLHHRTREANPAERQRGNKSG